MVHALAHQGVDVLVIDDNSPDGTGEIADLLASELPWVEVLHRPQKEGLGRAYVDGFRHVLASGAEVPGGVRSITVPITSNNWPSMLMVLT